MSLTASLSIVSSKVVALSVISGANGQSAYQLAVAAGFSGTLSEWLTSLIGPSITLQVSGGYIQWKLLGSEDWANLIAISEFTGPQGETGAPGSDAAVTLENILAALSYRPVSPTDLAAAQTAAEAAIPATTDGLTEGTSNLYFSSARALAAVTWGTLTGIPAWIAAAASFGKSLLATSDEIAAKSLLGIARVPKNDTQTVTSRDGNGNPTVVTLYLSGTAVGTFNNTFNGSNQLTLSVLKDGSGATLASYTITYASGKFDQCVIS